MLNTLMEMSLAVAANDTIFSVDIFSEDLCYDNDLRV